VLLSWHSKGRLPYKWQIELVFQRSGPEGCPLSTDGLLAVPEPSSLLLLVLAAGCLAATRARSCRNE